jgi:redox-sensing transcriptional repressor
MSLHMSDNLKNKMKKNNVSISVIKRLPRYFRYLSDLMNSGIKRISSKELSERMGITASQIRQDLNCFGGFGQQGYGYNIEALYNTIKSILGADCGIKAIIVGMGNLGTALAKNMNFTKRGVSLIGIFDISESKIDTIINGLTVMDVKKIKNFCQAEKPEIAILTLPKTETQVMAETLVECGVKGFWNFANMELKVDGAEVENMHLGDSLMMLCYAIKEDEKE